MAVATALLDAEGAAGAGEGRVGGKAFGLARLARIGANVPPFRVIAADAFATHLENPAIADVLRDRIQRISRIDPRTPAGASDIEAAAAPLRQVIESQPLAADVRAALAEALAALGPGPYAVRSSMVGEDSAERSFAGQLDTHLYQRTLDEVADAVVRCWASAFTGRALAYQLTGGISLAAPRMGVVVQRMIAGRVSGVVFTAHPVTGRRDHALCTAAWGLGEGVVSGRCNTDEIVWAHAGGEVSARIAYKDLEIAPAENAAGTIEREVDEARRNQRCLGPSETRAVCEESLRIARELGVPEDIEWTIAPDGTLYILQARPITTLPAGVVAEADGPRVVWDNSNIQESYCGVTTPLTVSVARAAYASVYEQTMRAAGIPESVIAAHRPILKNLLGLVRGRVYYNINNWYRGLLLLPSFGRNKSDMERMMGLDTPVDFIEDEALSLLEKARRTPKLVGTLVKLKLLFRSLPDEVERFLAEFDAAAARVDRRSFQLASFSRLMEIEGQLRRELLERWATPIVNDFFVMMASGRLRRAVESTRLPDGPQLIMELLAGEPGIESTEPTRQLMKLSRLARETPAVATALGEGPPLEALQRACAASEDWSRAFDHYIERYGDRVMGELKLETVTLREDPTFAVKVLRGYLARPDLDADRLTTIEREQRERAEKKVRAALPWRARLGFGSALADARMGVKNRENMRLARTRMFGLFRDVYRAIGRRLFEAGRLDAPRDVFYLATDEIADYHEGRAVSADLAALARARKAEFAGYERDELPHHFETRGPVHHGNVFGAPLVAAAAPAAADADPNILRGTGCYPGIVEAQLRVIMSPNDELSLDGRILCTLRTDPGWAPLFPAAKGILVERGSTLSHSAVVARELGIPAVVGVPDLLKRVKDGERVRLDGGTGVVEKLL